MQEQFTYKYYILGDSVPVRVSIDRQGREAGAETPSRETGALVFNHTYLSRLLESPEVEPVDEAEFNRRCEEFYAKKNGSDPRAFVPN